MNTCAEIVCFYHANCFDGMAAAWVVRNFYPNAEFIPVQYGDNNLITTITQDCYENANINTSYIIVDFSFPRELMIMMANKAKSIIVIDHHKTAQVNCEGLDFCVFDMNESGASLAWIYLHRANNQDIPNMPNLIKYIADRDLWKFKLPDSNYINAYIQSFPMTFNDYDYLYDTLENYPLEKAIDIGRGIERYKNSMVESMCKNFVMRDVGGYNVPTINSTLLFSEVGHYLAKNYPEFPFAASFFIRKDGKIQWSLRSIGEFDVSQVAKNMGGGGHKNAAGFETESL